MAKLFRVEETIEVRASAERCFQLATRIDIVQMELGMHPVEGPVSGAVIEGDRIRWQGWKFGLPQIHVSLIENSQPPFFFRDRMLEGRFRTFEHDHSFTPRANGTVQMHDEVRFSMPWGWPGDLIGSLIIAPYIRTLLRRRFTRLKRMAEAEG